MLESKRHPVSSKLQKGKRLRTITRTFRIKAEWDDVMKNEAERQGISVNVLANLIFRRYVLLGRWAKERNAIVLTQRTFQELITALPEEKIALLAEKNGASDIQNIFLAPRSREE